MNENADIFGCGYDDCELNSSHGYLLPALQTELGRLDDDDDRPAASALLSVGRFGMLLVSDVSSNDNAYANHVHPELRLETGSA